MKSTIEPSVLIIDDEIQLSESLKSKLEDEGYLVSICCDIQTAEKILRKQKFCCIVIDHRLRDGNGDTIVKVIRQTPLHLNYDTPIIYMSAHLSASFIKKIGNAVDSILVKPFARNEFAEKVKDLCHVEN